MDPVVTGKPDDILWKHNGNKVLEFSGTDEQVFGSYEGRVSVERLTGRLLIFDLRLEDSGEYELEVFTQGKWLQSICELEVVGETEFIASQVLFYFRERFFLNKC